MRIVVLVPSTQSIESAGVRIRYGRLTSALTDLGVSISVIPIDDFSAKAADCDAVVISKCYDARSLVVAAALSGRDIQVGVDLFDDYFSKTEDPRLRHYRTWLRQMLKLSDFVLCSTPAMAAVAESYGTTLAIHTMNDPAPPQMEEDLRRVLERKRAQAKQLGVLRLCWFGMGDNPLFPVGLEDLAAFGSALRSLAAAGIPLELSILTNRRALNGGGLALIESLPIEARVEEWSESGERDLLAQCDLCLLPVAAQPFSVSKSLNRAVTALSAGCQVLSLGFPLYAAFADLLYRDPVGFILDWKRGQFRLREDTAGKLLQILEEKASSANEAEALLSFLRSLPSGRDERGDQPFALLHGLGTTPAAHEAAKALGLMSVATPFCTLPLSFDLIVRRTPDGHLSSYVPGGSNLLAKGMRRAVRNGRSADSPPSSTEQAADYSWSLPLQLATYQTTMTELRATLAKDFNVRAVLLSEESDLAPELDA